MRLAVVGAGLIGRQHARLIADHPRIELAYVVDPFVRAEDLDLPAGAVVDRLEPVLSDVEGVIVATPNDLHREYALLALEAGVPTLVEKPLAESIDSARQIVDAVDRTGTPVLVGHHRRHSPLLAKAVETIAAGELGEIVAVNGLALFHKPDDYFDMGPWRTTRPGGGPILINLIHDVDNLRALCGDITRVRSVTSSARRGFEVEDTAAVILEFANGALGTFLLSDVAASARSWEQTSGENPHYDSAPDEDCYHIAGTRGSISVPTLRLRYYPDQRSWWEPFAVTQLTQDRHDPLRRQLDHFADVIDGTAQPKVTAADGLESVRVVAAVEESALTGMPVDLRTPVGSSAAERSADVAAQ